MNLKQHLLAWAGAALIMAPMAKAQDNDSSAIAGKVEDHAVRLATLESDVSGLKKLKLSGYIQARYEMHQDSKDAADTTGKYLNLDNFYIRRGRVKITYDAGHSVYTLQLDAAKDKVTLKDAEARFNFNTGPFAFNLRMGQFKWPFSYEVLRSSGDREMPERTKAIRSLLPGERDRGVCLGFTPNSIFDLNVGVFNGYGIENTTFPVITPTRNPAFVGRLTSDFGVTSVGVSGFLGKNAIKGSLDTTAHNYPYQPKDKNRFGADVQVYYPLPFLGGGRLMGEAIQGKDWSSTDTAYVTSLGWYGQVVQNIFEYDQIAVRYDSWDPNTAQDNDAITTLGVALVHNFSVNFKLTLAYEMPKHQDPTKEKDDNFFTAQVQCKF